MSSCSRRRLSVTVVTGYAGQISLKIGIGVALLSTIIGTIMGSLAGYFGRWIDQLLMRFTDLFLIVPGLSILMIAQKGLDGKELIGGVTLLVYGGILALFRTPELGVAFRAVRRFLPGR